QKQFRILRRTHRHPGPLSSDGRGRIVPRATADPTALESANDGSGCSLSRRTGEGQGEGQFVRTTPPTRYLFLHKPEAPRRFGFGARAGGQKLPGRLKPRKSAVAAALPPSPSASARQAATEAASKHSEDGCRRTPKPQCGGAKHIRWLPLRTQADAPTIRQLLAQRALMILSAIRVVVSAPP